MRETGRENRDLWNAWSDAFQALWNADTADGGLPPAGFVAGDVTDLPFADDAFDVAFSGWVYQMVEDLRAALAEARRVLRADGLLVFDLPHPFYELFDPETRELERSYHGPERRCIPIDDGFDADMVVFDRTVGDLHNAVVDAGFVVERVTEEPETDNPEAYDDPVESNGPELMAMVPRSLRFRATPA